MKKIDTFFFTTVLAASVFSGCARLGLNNASGGALGGAALGSGLGAIVGNQAGHHAGAGLAIGAAAGALGGAFIGNNLDNSAIENRRLEGQLNQNQGQIDENRRLIDELKRRGADVRSTKRGVVVNLPDILFQFDRAELTREAVRTIGEVGTVVNSVKNRHIAVEGHTDNVGSIRYNKDLSLRRAESVTAELSANGVSHSQMSVQGLGEGYPIATNNSEGGRSRNRRVEVIIEN